MNKDEALRLALEALETSMYPQQKQLQAITAVKAALEEKDEPHGWKLVPIEPTYEMLKAMDECSTEGYDERLYAGHAASVYMAAVNVAPSPSQQHAGDLAKLGWQYFECPACGSEGARAFPKQEAKHEPVAWIWEKEDGYTSIETHSLDDEDMKNVGVKSIKPLYAKPQFIGLTEDEIVLISAECAASHQHMDIHFARAIEAKLRSKNESKN
jgi:hypothetical protein